MKRLITAVFLAALLNCCEQVPEPDLGPVPECKDVTTPEESRERIQKEIEDDWQ